MEEEKINKDLVLREQLALQRTIMANQRTFLSFLRTSLYFAVAGLSIKTLVEIKQENIVAIVLWTFSFLLLAAGTISFFIQRKKIEKSRQQIGFYKL
jgi:putative membrane protein